MQAKLHRNYGDKQTIGMLYVPMASHIFKCFTIEPPWKYNQSNISCIPPGRYLIQKRWSFKFREHYILLNVYNRDYILIHSGNTYKNTKGCIIVGNGFKDLDGDGYQDVTNSRKTLDKLLELDLTEIIIE